MTQGYRNEKDPKPSELKASEAQLQDKITKLRTEILVVSRNLEELTSRLNRLQQNCKHAVFLDSPGFPYDIRHCVICGADLGWV